tara:strand:- start:27 stop:431 length:405 start_codon:yes stop_codon:yes gene_type:complete
MQKVFRTMNYKIYIIILACLAGALWGLSPWHPAKADVIEWKNKPVKCAPAHRVVEVMQSKGEHPIIWMDGFAQLPEKIAKSKYVISLNRDTFTWTVIEFMNPTEEGAWADACVLGFGRGVINMNLINNDGGIQL